MSGFPMFLVFGAMLFHDLPWHPQFNCSIDASSSLPLVPFFVTLVHCDLVSEEAGCTGVCMRNQGLLLAQFQLEFILQELSHSLFPEAVRFCL
jgi:hypothetical protein